MGNPTFLDDYVAGNRSQVFEGVQLIGLVSTSFNPLSGQLVARTVTIPAANPDPDGPDVFTSVLAAGNHAELLVTLGVLNGQRGILIEGTSGNLRYGYFSYPKYANEWTAERKAASSDRNWYKGGVMAIDGCVAVAWIAESDFPTIQEPSIKNWLDNPTKKEVSSYD